ncbi:MAG TPA: hypothetical protein VNT51_05370 [Miltoncostaeaceae bacterium]|nr:hypothetical protein [Miltoncostaeaceae bacterium]
MTAGHPPTTPDHRRTNRTGRRRIRPALALAAGAAAGGLMVAGPAVAQPPGVVCAPVPQYGPGATQQPQYGIPTQVASDQGNPSAVTLTRRQLLINQRISQAAIRRVNAIEQWLDAGVVGTDICGGALGPEDLGGMTLRFVDPVGTKPAPTPRPLNIRAVGGGDPGQVRLTTEQLLINQRISQTAVRRSNALRQRLLRGLTGGDVRDGSITRGQLRQGLEVVSAPPVANPPARSVTQLAPPSQGNPASVRLSRNQLLINQRISQAAVRRSNALIAHLRYGLNGNDFRANTITARDLAPGTVQAD